jgi:hypothetical protein
MRRSRRQRATLGLDRAFEGSEYEKTSHFIAFLLDSG